MADLVFQHAPNRATTSAAPGDTSWHKLSIPSAVPVPSGVVNCTVAIVATGAAGAAGTVLVDFDKSSNPTVGFPILSGQTDVFGYNVNVWYKLLTSTDTVWFLFAW